MMSRKLGSRIGRPQPDEGTPEPQTPSQLPPSTLDGDDLVAWLEEHDPASLPTDEELTGVLLTPGDWIASRDLMFASIFGSIPRPITREHLIAHFRKLKPDAIQSELGARVKALHRERKRGRVVVPQPTLRSSPTEEASCR